MGWGCSAAGKRAILGPLSLAYIPADKGLDTCDAVVVDVNAVLRKKLVYPGAGPERVPLGVMRQFLKTLCNETYPRAKTFVFCFDSAHLVPAERHVFYATKRYAPDKPNKPMKSDETRAADGKIYKHGDLPAPDEHVHEITPTHIPPGSSGTLVWSRLWNNPKTKARLWDVIAICLEFLIEERLKTSGFPQTFYIDGPDGTRTCFPSSASTAVLLEQGWKQWGEADTKCFQYAACLAGTHEQVVIDTIDWDMFIQILPHGIPNVHINIASVLRADGQNFYSEAAVERARKQAGLVGKSVRNFELVRGSALVAEFGSRRQRLHAMFWCLCCGGVDYCEGLRAFGFSESLVVKLLASKAFKAHKFLHEGSNPEAPTQRILKFCPRQFVVHLCALSGVKRKRAFDLHAFVAELYQILFCMLYYLGFDGARDRGGPVVDELKTLPLLLGEPSSATALAPDLFVETMIIKEAHPISASTAQAFPSALEYLFCALQRCAINKAGGG